ncbi:MAG: hypothetical protein E6Q25_01290 [Acinetobacter sp.]|nr:MAG: hypothetical protein E6Q25_01290 [Acinetobacter sp.]
MNAQIKPLNMLNTQINQLLIEQVGIVDTIRFFNQFNHHKSDVVQEHRKLAEKLTLDDIFADMGDDE